MILAIDPGATTGWCVYDPDEREVVDYGNFRGADAPGKLIEQADAFDVRVIERPVAHGPTRPQVVDCAYVAGILKERLGCQEITRLQVKQLLTEAVLGEIRVKDDATAWAACVLLHGPDSDRKPKVRKGQVIEPGGPIGGVRSHERAALALAVAWAGICLPGGVR